MDNFEKHIREHKDEFDEFMADRGKIWANISKKLEEPATRSLPLRRWNKLRIAASIAIILGITAFVALTLSGPDSVEDGDFLVNTELRDIDTHYKSLVSKQVQLVIDHPKLTEADKEEFLSFMDELDLEYEQLKIEMRKNLDNELVLEAVIRNYKKRIELIENLLRQISDANQINEDYGIIL